MTKTSTALAKKFSARFDRIITEFKISPKDLRSSAIYDSVQQKETADFSFKKQIN
jgi:hypothetical protein